MTYKVFFLSIQLRPQMNCIPQNIVTPYIQYVSRQVLCHILASEGNATGDQIVIETVICRLTKESRTCHAELEQKSAINQ